MTYSLQKMKRDLITIYCTKGDSPNKKEAYSRILEYIERKEKQTPALLLPKKENIET